MVVSLMGWRLGEGDVAGFGVEEGDIDGDALPGGDGEWILRSGSWVCSAC